MSHGSRLQAARQAFWAGDLDGAAQRLRRAQPKRGNSSETLLADQAIVTLLQGHPRAAEQMLRQVRDGFEALETTSAGWSAASLLTDDRQLPYPGDDYEKILVRSFLALANLMDDGQDAVAYCLQANQKQQQIVDAGIGLPGQNPKGNYHRIVMPAYLHGLLQEATHRGYDEAARAYAAVVEGNPDFAMAKVDLERALQGRHSAPGHGVVYVIGMVGAGPYKEESTEKVTSEAIAIAGQLLHHFGDRDIPPFTAPVKVPRVVVPPASVDSILVYADGLPVGATQVVTDVGSIAMQQCEAAMPHTVARAIARRILKKSAVYSAKDNLSRTSPWTGLAFDAAGFLWEATESADIRSWSLLPGTIQILRLETTMGPHQLTLQPAFDSRAAGDSESVDIQVNDGQNTYVLVCFPDRRIAGRILTSR